MIRRLLISEQERQSILKSYGLLSEGVGDDYLVLPNYSVQQVISFTVAVNSSGYNNISEFKKNCINTNSIPLSNQEKKKLLLNLNDKWDVLADKCMKEPKLTGVYDSNSLGGIKYTETPNKVYAEYQKNEEIKKNGLHLTQLYKNWHKIILVIKIENIVLILVLNLQKIVQDSDVTLTIKTLGYFKTIM